MKRMVRRGAHSETQKEERFAFKAESEALMDELYDAVEDDVRLFLCIMILVSCSVNYFYHGCLA